MTRPAAGPYHEGEREVQRRAGAREAADRLATMRQGGPSRGAWSFLLTVSVVVVGGPDAHGRRWASPLFGEPGFVRPSPDGLRVCAHPGEGDPLAERRAGDPVGLLGLDLSTARRYRVNGRVLDWGPEAIEVGVDEAYGNCSRHIRRQDVGVPASAARAASQVSAALTPPQMRQIRESERMFVATCHPDTGADVSHKGGPPGFVRVLSPERLRFPDLPGNNLFNTLGNLYVDPRIGLLFHDFDRAATLQVTGEARIDFGDVRDPAPARAVEVAVTSVVYRER